MQTFKTAILMVVLMLVFVFVGSMIGGVDGMIVAFLIAICMNFIAYFFSDKIVLSRYGANKITSFSHPEIYQMLFELSKEANLPMPNLYLIDDEAPNAFATGRNPNNAAVVLTSGLLKLMNKNEVKAVMAHELGHINHYDILTGSVAAMFAGAIAILANMTNAKRQGSFLILAIVMPLVATIIKMSISRSREYAADEFSANITKNPQWLINALSKLEIYSKQPKNFAVQTAHMFIINPLKSDFATLFRTHPTTEDRIKNLQSLQYKSPLNRYFGS